MTGIVADAQREVNLPGGLDAVYISDQRSSQPATVIQKDSPAMVRGGREPLRADVLTAEC